MFSRFLRESAEITGDSRLAESADEFRQIGDGWERLGEWFRQVSEAPEPDSMLDECVGSLNALAELEETAWQRLQEIASV